MKLDFFVIRHKMYEKKAETFIDVYPEFLVKESSDLMTRGGKFYAVLNKKTGFWETNEFKIQEYVDEELYEYVRTNKEIQQEKKSKGKYCHVNVMAMVNNRSRSWIEYKTYINNLPDFYHQLDDKLCFECKRVDPNDYISKMLPYKLQKGPSEAWDRLVGTLYDPSEREKLEWAIGSIIAGDSKEIQKFLVLYGEPGAGKGTILKIIQKLFPGYYEVFDAKSLSSNNNAFAFEQFRSNPLIALQMDGDLSRISDNTKLNSLVSHETILMNEKRKQSYSFTPRCFLFMASNREVQMTDANSGLLRRLIDVNPSGRKLPKREYDQLMGQIKFELSGIAWYCLNIYRKLGKNYYNAYEPKQMMLLTNPVYNFLKDSYEDPLKSGDLDPIQLQELYSYWTDYCTASGITNRFARYQFLPEVKPYYEEFKDRGQNRDGKPARRVLCGLKVSKLYDGSNGRKEIRHDDPTSNLVLDQDTSLLDILLADCQAQYAEDDGSGGSKPIRPWSMVTTTLKNLDTKKLHFVRLPKNHIVIDFDLKNDKGEKDAVLNLQAAEKWPATYAEYSQGGKGIHLHYIYNGDPDELASLYAKDIEIKVFKGKGSLRRRLSVCNNVPVATINGDGLPKKEVKETVDFESLKDVKHIRNIIAKCLKKEISQPYTAPAISLIKKTLDDAYDSGIEYDVRDLRPAIRAFAAKSTHQKQQCMKMVEEIKWFSKHFDEDHKWDGSVAGQAKDISEAVQKLEEIAKDPKRIDAAMDVYDKQETRIVPQYNSEELVFFDIEVFPNLFLVNWKTPSMKACARMINPSGEEIRELCHNKLVGFNCRRYDNHILYSRMQGASNAKLYHDSQNIISGSRNAMYGPAYNLSYTDVYDFAAKKQSLKKWEIELGIHHQELGLPWDKPVPEERWTEVAEYCDNDVIATEAVFNHLAGDFKAREILADIAGMSVNDTTNMLTTRIIFGDDPRPQTQFNYPDLTKMFPEYRFEGGKSYYRHDIPLKYNTAEEIQAIQDEYKELFVKWNSDLKTVTVDEIIGEGGRVYARPGIYHHVVTYDVASMHPSSIIAENGFGKYTERFKQLMDIRVAIKHKDFDAAKKMLDGKLAKYLTDKDQAKALSQALKIAINSVYGLTAAGFDNKFRDPRNKDNWVAKRGALFMEQLRLEVQKMGATVVHIKTDSIKIENPTKKVTDYILKRGKEYGYTFEVEDIYEKICLVNDAVYIALRDRQDPGWIDECEKAKKNGKPEPTRWTATGAQFQHPYVFKTLFSHEPIEFMDLCETKTVTSALYLDLNENLTDVSLEEKELDKLNSRVKKLLKEIGYPGPYDEWLDEELNKRVHCYSTEKILTAAEVEQIEAELLDLSKDRDVLNEIISKGHNYIFIGKAGSFCPVKAGLGGGILCREKDGKFYSATGAKGYRWREGESLRGADRMDLIDMGYFEALGQTAKEAVDEFAKKIGSSFEEFASERELVKKPAPGFITIDEVLERSDEMFGKAGEPGNPPWLAPCGRDACFDCRELDGDRCRKGYDLTNYIAAPKGH